MQVRNLINNEVMISGQFSLSIEKLLKLPLQVVVIQTVSHEKERVLCNECAQPIIHLFLLGIPRVIPFRGDQTFGVI